MKKVVGVVAVLLLLSFVGESIQFFIDTSQIDFWTPIIGVAGRLAAIIILLKQGTLRSRTYLFRFTLFLITLMALGNLFQLMDWPYGKPLAVLPIFFICIIYAIHFAKKKLEIHLLDNLKFLWVLVFCASAFSTTVHFPFADKLKYIQGLLLLITFLHFGYMTYCKNNSNSTPDL